MDQQLLSVGFTSDQLDRILTLKNTLSSTACWQQLCSEFPAINYNFNQLRALYRSVYPTWEQQPAPVWFPTIVSMQQTHLADWLCKTGYTDYKDWQRWTCENYQEFWKLVCDTLPIQFSKPSERVVDLAGGVESPRWFPDGLMNITSSCFNAHPTALAIVFSSAEGSSEQVTYGDLADWVNRVANSLVLNGFKKGDAIAVALPMTPVCVAIYLGIIKAGCIAIAIADSFAAAEITTRLSLAQAKAIFTQFVITRKQQDFPLYAKIIKATAIKAIVITSKITTLAELRPQDQHWDDFLTGNTTFTAINSEPASIISLLFSSGTTGTPKVIPWHQTTAIKCATDAYFHHDLKPGEIMAWPTNLGWMMGPWLIFAVLINRGTLALYEDTPTERQFGEFIQNQRVNLLGVVPSLVKTWRTSGCMINLDWRALKLFSSTGECSNIDDMLYLMSLAGNKPIIEYCGGTEIGGAYLSGTLLQPAAPAAFTTPAVGSAIILLDEQGNPAQKGEVALVPPAIGLSAELLNNSHHDIYFAGMPSLSSGQTLRRHGDLVQCFANGFYRVLGRADDTMNLSGIKISAAEIERVVLQADFVNEVAAIAIPPAGGGPDQLVLYLVTELKTENTVALIKNTLQKLINVELNPLFKIHAIVNVASLPRTASNKIMRRTLRDAYHSRST